MTAQELAAQIKAQWGGYGDWNAGGVDRSLELATMLQAQGINSIDGLTSRQKEYQGVNQNYGHGNVNSEGGGSGFDSGNQSPYGPQNYDAYGHQIRFGDEGKWLGFLGNFNLDGSMGSNAGKYTQTSEAKDADVGQVAWSARGDGNVSYNFAVDPATGKAYIAPSWGSSSDKDDIIKTIGVLAAPFAVGYGLQALGFGAAGTSGAAGAVTAGTAAELGALNAGATLGGGAAAGGAAAAGGGVLTAGEFGALPGVVGEGTAAGLAGVDGVLTAAPGGGLYGGAAGGGLLSNIPAGLKDALGPAWELIKNNPRIVGALAGGLLGGSDSGTDGGETPYTGPMPTITRGAWKPQVTPQYMQQPTYGLLQPQGKPLQNSGLGRYMGLLGG